MVWVSIYIFNFELFHQRVVDYACVIEHCSDCYSDNTWTFSNSMDWLHCRPTPASDHPTLIETFWSKLFSVAKATLHSQMSVRSFVCPSVSHRNPSTAWNHHPSSFILQPRSFFLHPSFISCLLSFSACFKTKNLCSQSSCDHIQWFQWL